MNKRVIGALGALALAACGSSEDAQTAGKALVDCSQFPATSRTEHGAPVREDGEVTVTQENGRFVARRQVSLENGTGGAAALDVTFVTANGIVVSCGQSAGGYAIGVFLEGRGGTEDEARRALDSMTVLHSDTTTDRLVIETRIQFNDGTGITSLLPLPLPGLTAENLDRSASILAGVPAAASYALRQSTSNGGTEATGLSGTLAELGTANGSVALGGEWNQASLQTSNGDVVAAGDFVSLEADAGNGNLVAFLATRRSATARLTASNGAVDAHLVKEGSPAYDLQAAASNGSVSIDASGTEAVGEQTETSAHRRSPGYEGSAVQVAVTADVSSGNVSIREE